MTWQRLVLLLLIAILRRLAERRDGAMTGHESHTISKAEKFVDDMERAEET